ncbi:CLUMA_CG016341, isoform A [Clunio marinus]|uniref:CLUMA_CG016341, isoform A n=1 Tax=Clunio marinus TaxID=568069 RepID=A0A1J1IW82_9DIPT|nr:CLUMA_CG016341, isoform A [Clunio marinus]
MLFYRSVFKCILVLAITKNHSVQCEVSTGSSTNNQVPPSSSLLKSSLINDDKVISRPQFVTVNDNDKFNLDKSDKTREFPPSARYKRQADRVINYGSENIISTTNSFPRSSECILSRSEYYLSWWVNEDGSLRLPGSNRTGNSSGFADLSLNFNSESAIVNHISQMTTDNPNDVINFLSLANNRLSQLPFEVFQLVNASLQYLSLANNNFQNLFTEHNKTFQYWTAFPLMNNLKELDLRNCSLYELEEDLFVNLHNLEKLFLSNNNLASISPETFSSLDRLRHLDLSYNNEIQPISPYNQDPFSYYFESGLLLHENVFKNLEKLIFLDLSHTKLRMESVRSLAGLGEKVEQLSLCYTEIPLIVGNMFQSTNLKVLDLSGNPTLTPSLNETWFGGLEPKLEILVIRNANIKSPLPFINLKKLRMLDLGNNNINEIHLSHFINYEDLEILDLYMNHISNWYERVFQGTKSLKIMNLRHNNINLITPEMMADFGHIRFLAIGANNFVCDCSLRDFIDRAAFNALISYCENKSRKRRSLDLEKFYDPKYHYEVFLREYHNYIKYVDESYKNIFRRSSEEQTTTYEGLQNFVNILATSSDICYDLKRESKNSNSSMNFDFLLMDYDSSDYHCIQSNGTSKAKVIFNDITPCVYSEALPPISSTLIPTTSNYTDHDKSPDDNDNEGKEDDDDDDDLKIFNKEPKVLLVIYLSVGIPTFIIAILWYWKRRDIKYFLAIFKNTLILSLDKDDKKSLMLRNRRKSNNKDDPYNYDVFVSYSDKDRNWVLDELIPNLERRAEIKICLHERDFQVGLSILENIIHSMDQSRCLLLVISESFLKSNWCSFEMHLAQHRLIETRREQLILVLLQDIPKSRRPRTLTFLMRTKTYIMWPNENKPELRNVFWRRLKKAIILNNWEPERHKAKPRHSIV